jgi:hypothetical protein
MVQVQPKQAKYKYTTDVYTPCCRQTYKQTFMWGGALECLSFLRKRFRSTENLEPGMVRVWEYTILVGRVRWRARLWF